MSMCFTRVCNIGSSDKFIDALLSHIILIGLVGKTLIPVSRAHSQIASLVVSKAAMYSASHEEAATVFCFFVAHDIAPDPKEKVYPPMLLRVSRQFAQSESVYPRILISLSPAKWSFKSFVPFI
jgi:hypothetical protein